MYDHDDKRILAPSTNEAGTAEAERRGVNRQPFIAAADVVDIDSGARFSTRTTDVGFGGCFLDTLVPFEVGSKVRVSIREGQNRFDAAGIVVYSQAGLGMGIAFDVLEPEQHKALAVWLGEEVPEHREPQTSSHDSRRPGLPHGSDRVALLRLVKLMRAKGILSESEAVSIFSDPVLF